MHTTDEHDDDLEPEVSEGAEIETVDYTDDEDLDEGEPGSLTNPVGRLNEETPPPADIEEEEPEGDASDTI
jgi:hypothetical protein